MMGAERDPGSVRLDDAVIVVTTDCCEWNMALPRVPVVDLGETRRLCCFWCGRVRQLRFVTEAGRMRAVWSDPPRQRRWWWL